MGCHVKNDGINLEYINDIEQYTFVEENLRGGVTTINHRLFTANNKYLDDYDPQEPSSFIIYIDANNLYGAGMMSKLPYGGFRWLETNEIDNLDIKTINSDGEICYILEVDLDYPKHLHDNHSDYPLAVEKKIIIEDQISQVNQEFLKINKEKFRPSTKLVLDLHNKIKYVCSLRNLQLYLNKGLVLKKIHRVLVANQKNYMSSYIEFNSLKATSS